jgi:hypothetical protein
VLLSSVAADSRQFAGRTTDKIDTTDTIVKLEWGSMTPRGCGYKGGGGGSFF